MKKNETTYEIKFFLYLLLLFIALIPGIGTIIIIILFSFKLIDLKKLSKEELESQKIELYLKNNILDLEETHNIMKEQIDYLNNLQIDSFIFEYYDDCTNDELKIELEKVTSNYKNFIKNDNCILDNIGDISYMDKSHQKEINREKKETIKRLIRCFESDSNTIVSNLTIKNYDNSVKKIIKSFNTLNNAFFSGDIKLNDKVLKLKLEQLNILKQIMYKEEEEKEIEKLRKEQLREEEKVRREIEKAKEKIEKEEKQFNNELKKIIVYMDKATNDAEKELYADKIKELEEKIKLLEKDKENVLQRETNTRAGFVYIISNIGAFGENIFKIGMTRRLEPLERISELSSASVPFPFDVHALIFSDDAPSLENELHKHFQNESVNKVNLRKEFFKIDTQILKDYILNKFGQTIQFIDIPEAEQYRESIKILENIN